jgi:hypothetical protein
LNEDAKEQIQFLYASKDHQFMVDKILKQEQGVTFEALAPDEAPEEGADGGEPAEGEDGEVAPKVVEKKEKLPKFKLVEEVVRDQKIHYYMVPRLGSYLAIKLEYESCLFEEAFDSAVVDFAEVQIKRHEQDIKKREWEDHQAELKQEKEDNGEEFHPDVKVWDPIEQKPFKTKKIQYVVCLNTLGQDRKFTEEEKLYALRTVQKFRDRWEILERENLQSDVAKKLERAEYEKFYKDHYETIDHTELERIVEDAIANA